MKKLRFPAALLVAAAILMHPEAAASGAQRAMRIWYMSVVPSLFPFLVLLPLLTDPDACAAYDRIFGRIMRPVFRLPGTSASAMIVGMLSGSPGGAIAILQVASQGGLSAAEARRLALCMCGVSPAFLIFGVGRALFGSVRIGVCFAAAQLATQLLMLFATRRMEFGDANLLPQEITEPKPVRAAVGTMLCICGYMTFFSALGEVVSDFLGGNAGNLFVLISDLPSGLNLLAESAIRGKFLIAGGALGFGGLCIGMQNLDALRQLGTGVGTYFSVRAAAAAACACICAPLRLFRSTADHVNYTDPFVFSALIVFVTAIPVLIFFSDKCILNNQKMPGKG